ncbi:MAG: winged helix-turn-helix domain-containing protein [Sulfolobales archaeon]
MLRLRELAIGVVISSMDRDPLQNIFRSPGRYRVLKYLLAKGGGNITRISREINLSHNLVKKYLEEMKEIGLVEEIRIGRTRYFIPVWSDVRVRLIKDLIESQERRA